MKEIIDAHSHIFPSYRGPKNDFDVYNREVLKLGVRVCVVSPGPCPEYKKNDFLYRPCVWDFRHGEFLQLQQFCSLKTKEVLSELPAIRNPFLEINEKLLKLADELKNSPLRMKIMPLIHPLLDEFSIIERWINETHVGALKFHGLATAMGPEDISQEVVGILQKTNRPIVVHTDYLNIKPVTPMQLTYKMNDSRLWVKWAKETKIKTLITHGARLSLEAIELARGCKNIKFGIAPGLLMGTEQDRLAKETDDYESAVLKMVPPEQLLFDIDFGWNVKERGEWDHSEWEMVTRIETKAKDLGLTNNEIKSVFYNNSAEFFQL